MPPDNWQYVDVTAGSNDRFKQKLHPTDDMSLIGILDWKHSNVVLVEWLNADWNRGTSHVRSQSWHLHGRRFIHANTCPPNCRWLLCCSSWHQMHPTVRYLASATIACGSSSVVTSWLRQHRAFWFVTTAGRQASVCSECRDMTYMTCEFILVCPKHAAMA